MTNHYDKIRNALTEAGVSFCDQGSASENLGGQVYIGIYDEQGMDTIDLIFDIDEDGNATFVCQE